MKTDWHMDDALLDQYLDEVCTARDSWKGKLTVFLGLELDYIKGLCSAADKDIHRLELDYTIGSVHYIFPKNGAAPFTVDGPPEELETGIRDGFGGDGQAMMHAYWDALAEMIALGGFDILGHADIIKKNNRDNRLFDMQSEEWLRRMEETACAAGKSGCVAELNTGMINRGRSAETSPSLIFLRLLRERNVPIIITADAHRAADLDGNYETAVQTLTQAGYEDHVLFEGRDSGRALWRREKINDQEFV
jgi:histidinol-phosphatase (PHP family)